MLTCHDCFGFSGSIGCMEKQVCKQQSSVLTLVSTGTWGGALCCGYLSSCQDGWAHLAAFCFGMPDGHSNPFACWLGEGIPGAQRCAIPISQLKSWDAHSLFVQSEAKQEPCGRTGEHPQIPAPDRWPSQQHHCSFTLSFQQRRSIKWIYLCIWADAGGEICFPVRFCRICLALLEAEQMR